MKNDDFLPRTFNALRTNMIHLNLLMGLRNMA